MNKPFLGGLTNSTEVPGSVGIMGDPELRSDETVILRTQGIFVKSIPFEGILTNKRIILLDKAKNLLPQKEIPLVTIKDIVVGENAIRDQIITLSVVARSGEIRQMILTFSRQTGGNRIRERDAWAKALKENISSSFEQVIRKVIPGRGPAPRKPEHTVPPRIEIVSPGSRKIPPAQKTFARADTLPQVKISESTRPPSPAPGGEKGSGRDASGFGTYCSQCGNRVPEGSGFCNRCGSPIVLPVSTMVPMPHGERVHPPMHEAAERTIPQPVPVESPAEPVTDLSAEEIQEAVSEFSQEPEAPQEPEIFVPPEEEAGVTEPTIFMAEEEALPETAGITESSVIGYNPPAKQPPPRKNPRGFSFRPGRNAVYAAGAVLLIIAVIVGGFLIYPSIVKGGSVAPGTTASPTPTTTTPGTSGTIIPKVTTEVTLPAEGVYVHIKYLGSWKGSYGIPSELRTLTNSGDRYYPVENATGTVEASFEKLDSSTRQTLLVEILKNGRILTQGNTTSGFGKVNLSVDTATGVAKSPQVS
ncbi:MAG TPA: zinc-ribbon domain-containing protein [Methanoregula sp.]|nr:zinc-ribbon domain-containing protein [Methanoregula sp.]